MEKNNRILIVDDQKDLCEQLAKLLKQSGRENETLSLVQQMRARLLGIKEEVQNLSENELEDENVHYEIEYVFQGQDAVQKVADSIKNSSPYALIFLDMRMPPGWDGLETAKRIRELDKDVEIVIMTAYADHDQKQIAEQVGHPEKLLYIKKPFQAEEIFQLALSLTTKWNLEFTEKRRKKWLESVIRGLCKLKNPSCSKAISTAFISALRAFLDLMESEKGIAIFLDENNKWRLQCFNGLSEDFALRFIDENNDFLRECRTTKHKDDIYFIPVRKDNYFAIFIIFEVKTKNDPEWYKLLSILNMMVADVLFETFTLANNKSKWEEQLLKEFLPQFVFTIQAKISNIVSNLNIINEQETEKLIQDQIRKGLEELEEIKLYLRSILLFGGSAKCEIRKGNLFSTIQEGLLLGIGTSGQVKIDCDQNTNIFLAHELLRDLFAHLAVASKEASAGENLEIYVKANSENNVLKIHYSDTNSSITNDKLDKISYAISGSYSGNLLFTAIWQIVKKLGGSIEVAKEAQTKNCLSFSIELPIPSA